jgi:SAM-dependent methyltransferase
MCLIGLNAFGTKLWGKTSDIAVSEICQRNVLMSAVDDTGMGRDPFIHPDAYDLAILHPQYRKMMGGNYYNFGLWSEPTDTPDVACARLTQSLINFDSSPQSAKTVLDVGCGLGAGTDQIARYYNHAKVCGLNYSSRQIARAEATYHRSNLRFQYADALALPFPDATIDRIFCIEAAMHFQTRAEFFAEARRSLRPNGRLILADILCNQENSVIPMENVVSDTAAYASLCQTSGFDILALETVTDQVVRPFAAFLRQSGRGPIARFIEGMTRDYVLVSLSKKGRGQ